MGDDGDDARLCFPATERNREAIGTVLEPLLPAAGLVLELASGSGEHLCYLQQRFGPSRPGLRWLGSDPDPPASGQFGGLGPPPEPACQGSPLGPGCLCG